MSVQKNTDKKSATRRRFLDAAREIFAQKGFQAANVSDIVQKVASGQGTFYYHFADKQAIFDELMLSFVDRLAAALAENEVRAAGRLALASRNLSIENARALATVFIENLDLATLFFKESRYIGGAAMERIERFYSLLYAQLENGLEEGCRAGLVRPELVPRIAARMMVGAAEKVIIETASAGGPVDLDLLAEQISDFQSFGILARPAENRI